MMISMIVAVSENGVIGKEGDIPWHLSTDLKRFKELTMDHHLLVGRKTYESIGGALPGRTMLVISHQEDYEAPGCKVVHSLEEGLDLAKEAGDEEAFIAGGASIYQEGLLLADRIYFTRVHAEIDGDTFFPQIEESEWIITEQTDVQADLNNDYNFTFMCLDRDKIDPESH